MSIGPTNWAAGIAGSQASQNRGTDADKRTAESVQQLASADAAQRSAVDGTLQENESTQDRDADGRNLAGRDDEQRPPTVPADEAPAEEQVRRSKDPSGSIGRQIDLSG